MENMMGEPREGFGGKAQPSQKVSVEEKFLVSPKPKNLTNNHFAVASTLSRAGASSFPANLPPPHAYSPMTVLRSREVLPLPPTPKSLQTPSNTLPRSPLILSSPSPAASATHSTALPSDGVSGPGASRRRSSRLAAKGLSTEHSREMKSEAMNDQGSGLASSAKMGVRSICSGVDVLDVNEGAEGLSEPGRGIDFGRTGSKSVEVNGKGKRKLNPTVDSLAGELFDESPDRKQCLSLRSGKKVLKTVKQEKGVGISTVQSNSDGIVEERQDLKDNDDDAVALSGNGEVARKELKEECSRIDDNDCAQGRSRFSRREKGKWILDDQSSNGNDTGLLNSELNDEVLNDNVVARQNCCSVRERPKGIVIVEGKRKLTGASYNDMDADGSAGIDLNAMDEAGVGQFVVDVLLSLSEELRKDSGTSYEDCSRDGHQSSDETQDTESSSEEEVQGNNAAENRRLFLQRLTNAERDSLRRTALEFAHCDYGDDQHPRAEAEDNIEDWPGPFSTAMKIASDRAKGLRVKMSSKEENVPAPVAWTPRKDKRRSPTKSLPPPALRDLCLQVLAKNADAISSLDFVPDAFRHKLTRLLCDSRKMNRHFLDLLLCGSPTEVCIWDCSWLSEEEFVKSFQGCDTSKLVILQLDQCGRCIPDYVVLSTLAQSPNSLPALESLSIKGGCRLSDIGMAALVSSAPALQSLNLSQCSFLTSSSIDSIANSLGSTLRELYLDDCQNLNPRLMISAMMKLEHLEVLSFAGIKDLDDGFFQEFLTARGRNLKQLILTNCVELTDKSMKAISENCSALCAIDLVNLSRLTDYALCCLASGCPALQKLKLSRNLFSDEAVSAFVEISGENLKELSLNNIKKVGRCTAISLACFSKNLVSLDLSWCRKLTNEALGLIVDNCPSLRVLRLFGCSQVTEVFLDGHSNPDVEIIGLKFSPVWLPVEPHKFWSIGVR